MHEESRFSSDRNDRWKISHTALKTMPETGIIQDIFVNEERTLNIKGPYLTPVHADTWKVFQITTSLNILKFKLIFCLCASTLMKNKWQNFVRKDR